MNAPEPVHATPVTTNKSGVLFLIPTNLSTPFSASAILPADVAALACRLDHFVAENAKTARAFLKTIGVARPLAEISIIELDKHAKVIDADRLLAPLLAGHDVGLVSEAGAPAVADPGAVIVAAAHRAGIVVRPMVGPSSILLALMASGLNGQSFAFHGYLPQDKHERSQAIQMLERESRQKNMTQIFIETPYRNSSMTQDLLATLAPSTTLCIATDLTGAQEHIRTRRISQWRTDAGEAGKLPAIFLFLA